MDELLALCFHQGSSSIFRRIATLEKSHIESLGDTWIKNITTGIWIK
jgi:hypothetical protein